MKNFILIGASGYIAPRHMKAIFETGNNLIAAYDPFDSVGIIDSYFPDADFFTEFEIFDRHIEKLKSNGIFIDFVTICSPNYLHDSHIRFGLRIGANIICEKPIVLNPWNLDSLIRLEKQYNKKIYSILQLRLHPSAIELKSEIDKASDKKSNISLKYITSRGKWYKYSWKGNKSKSGGVATNIGVHFFDFLIWIFGDVIDYEVDHIDDSTVIGKLFLEKGNVNWELSIDFNRLPNEVKESGKRTYRSININNKVFEFSGGFFDLHTKSYSKILSGDGFRAIECRKSIELVQKIRNIKK